MGHSRISAQARKEEITIGGDGAVTQRLLLLDAPSLRFWGQFIYQ